jgi:2-iminobutanoate/2-iminopropanoate deaminase
MTNNVPPIAEPIKPDPDWYAPFKIPVGYRVGDLIILSGQAPWAPGECLVGVGDFDAQAAQVFENIRNALAAAGSDISKVVKASFYLTDAAQIPKVTELRERHFVEPYPAEIVNVISSLSPPEVMIEVDIIAVRGQ